MDLREWPLPGPKALVMDVHEVAKFFGVNAETLRRWIREGRFPVGQRHGGAETWSGADIAAYIQLRGRWGIGDDGQPQTDDK